MAFVLKTYQQRCLDELARYLRRTWELQDADAAFREQGRRDYHHVEALKGLPYVCIRVPTGGGKTVLAAHAIDIAASNLLRSDRVLVLWLAPTTQIVEQSHRAHLISHRQNPIPD
jgi:type III restriction enzyme